MCVCVCEQPKNIEINQLIYRKVTIRRSGCITESRQSTAIVIIHNWIIRCCYCRCWVTIVSAILVQEQCDVRTA